MTLKIYLLKLAEQGIQYQQDDGSFPAGVNGPYKTPETAVRNTCHWFLLLKKAFEITKEEKYYAAAKRAIDFVLQQENRPYGYTFFSLKSRLKDRANGLIGQAWVCEALVAASELFSQDVYKRTAQEVFLLHPFDSQVGIWKIIDIDGTEVGFDYTFNHQLWFAAIGASLIDKTQNGIQIQKQLDVFVESLPKLLQVDGKGLVRHGINRKFLTKQPLKVQIRQVCKRIIKKLFFPKKTEHYLNPGYHLFNVYGFGILKTHMPHLSFWKSDIMKKMLSCITTDWFLKRLEHNPYTYPYNPPGFECLFVSHVSFSEYFEPQHAKEVVAKFIKRQFQITFSRKLMKMCHNTDDPQTLTARSYELVRVPPDILDLYQV